MNVKNLYFGCTSICKKALVTQFNVTQYMVDTVFKEFNSGVRKYVHDNSNKIYMRPRQEKAISVIKYFSFRDSIILWV